MAANKFLFLIDPDGNVADSISLRYSTADESDQERVPSRWGVRAKPKNERQRGEVLYDDVPGTYRRTVRLGKGYSVRQGTRKERDEWMASRPDPGYIDCAGKPVTRGSIVAVAFALGRGAEIRIGRVIGYDKLLGDEYGYDSFRYPDEPAQKSWRDEEVESIPEDEQIVIEWLEGNALDGWRELKGKSTKIFAYLRRYVVIE